jgi:diguanylate cyclase (GGDEF)-like protein
MGLKAPRNISSLVRMLVVLAIFSAIAIIVLTGFGMYRVYSRQVIDMAEKEAVLISHLLVHQNYDTLFSRRDTDILHLQIDPLEVSWLNQSFSEFFAPLDIVKIKIFNPDMTVVYSTDNGIIGENVPDNPRLLRALAGFNDSQLEVKDKLRDLRNETAFDVDVVETYTPIIVAGKILGVFELYIDVTKFRTEIRKGTLHSLILLSTVLFFVYLIAFSVARTGMKKVADAESRLRTLAMTDALTGVLNRGELMTQARAELARIGRGGTEAGNGNLGLIMLDIDHFKRINDTHGHQTGDEVLRQIPDRIRQAVRIYDILGRYGGEEFMILLPSVDLEGACTVAERIRGIIAGKPFIDNSTALEVRVSLGVATLSADLDLEQAIKLADEALYRAKQKGRNRVEKQEPG